MRSYMKFLRGIGGSAAEKKARKESYRMVEVLWRDISSADNLNVLELLNWELVTKFKEKAMKRMKAGTVYGYFNALTRFVRYLKRWTIIKDRAAVLLDDLPWLMRGLKKCWNTQNVRRAHEEHGKSYSK